MPRGSCEEGAKHTSVAGGHTQGLGFCQAAAPLVLCLGPACCSLSSEALRCTMGLKTNAGQHASLQVLWEAKDESCCGRKAWPCFSGLDRT